MAEYDPKWEENTFDLTLTEAELRSAVCALHAYAGFMMNRLSEVLQHGIWDQHGYVRDATKDEIRDARRATDRAYVLQERLRKMYSK